jgi:hypothetical protein
MKIRLLVSIVGLVSSSFVFGQGWQPVGSRSRSMADASVTLTDVWSYHHNPAALAKMEKWGIGIAYENRFLLKELQSQSFSVAVPLKKGVVSAGMQSFGYTQFRSMKVGMGYSLKLSELFCLGVQMNMHQLRLPQGYGVSWNATGEAGLLAQITPVWNVGFAVVNFTRTKLSDYQEDRLTTVMRLGTSYRFSKKLLVAGEAEKNIDYPIRAKAGIEYLPADKFAIRTGFATSPIEMNVGFGYAFKNQFLLDFGTAYNQKLGWSPNVSFTYQLKK